MKLVCDGIKSKTNVFQDIRALLQLGLTGNQLKVALTYLIEKDEASRQVRGKAQDDLCAVSGMSRSRFAQATADLIDMGVIETQRRRQSAQTITVRDPQIVDICKSETSTNRDIYKTDVEMSANQGLRDPENADMPKEVDSIVDSKSTPERASAPDADELHRQAYQRGLEIKGNKVAKSARAIVRGKGELDGSKGIEFTDGKLTVVNGTAHGLEADFPGIDLKAVCNKAAPELSKFSYPKHEDAVAVLRKWAQIEVERMLVAAKAKKKPFDLTRMSR